MSYLMEFRVLIVGILLIGGNFFSTNLAAKEIVVEQGYVRATIPGTSVSSAYMDIINKQDRKVTLIGASSSVSDRVEIHEHIMADGMMKMRQRESILIGANSKVSLQPSGYHLMIFDLKKPLQPKEQLTLTLHFLKQPDVDIVIPVQSIKRKKKSHHHH